MKPVSLSKRLRAAADLVTPGSRVCDVGCDHGFVAIYLVEQGISGRVIAMDVNRGPLARAAAHIGERNLSAYIETRLSDGFASLSAGEADTAILAGMGGRLTQAILRADREKTEGFRELILQPQSEIPALRRFLRAAGYQVVAEEMVAEEGKFYPLMKVVPGTGLREEHADVKVLEGRDSQMEPEVRYSQPQPENNDSQKIRTGSGYQILKDDNYPKKREKDGTDNRIPCDTSTAKAEQATSQGNNPITREDRWGRLLLARRHPVLKQYLLWEMAVKTQILTELGGSAENVFHGVKPSGDSAGSRLFLEENRRHRKQERILELKTEIDEIRQILAQWTEVQDIYRLKRI